MPKILVTGNGFDLNVGLPTSYSDFIKILSFVENHYGYDFNSIYSNSQNYSILQDRFNNFDLDETSINNLKTEISHNLWYQFFKTEFQIETWIDFENKIEYVLEKLFSSAKFLKESVFGQGAVSNRTMAYDMSVLKNDIGMIQMLKTFKLIDFNGRHIFLSNDYLISKHDYFIDIDLDKMAKVLYNQLIHFKLIFNYYFESFVYPFYAEVKFNTMHYSFSTISKHYTFNYTPTFEKFNGEKKITSYLHGTINSKDNQIVLGINEVPEKATVEKIHFLPFTKYFQKLNNNTDYSFLNEFESRKNENYQFFFIGHSMDKSDADYINEIFDFLSSSKSRVKKIIIAYHNESSKFKLLINLLYIRGKTDIEKRMKNRDLIFVPIDSDELKRELNYDISIKPLSI